MASTFYPCICGSMAMIDMFAWVCGTRVIACRCGRKLWDEGIFCFDLKSAKFAWAKYMRQEAQSVQGNQ